mmetsp:Transcript_15998/g.28506  ORF Transcript_15998/g.28506 Transcript_15998/m.28506 type:complete len:1118 (+) Transcript_15998:208-3561(+)
MENALGALRLLVTGKGSEGEVFRCASLVRHAGSKTWHLSCKQVQDADEIDVSIDSEKEDGELDQSEDVLEDAVQAGSGSADLDVEEVSELYTWGQAANYQLGFGMLGHMQPLPRCVPLRTPAKATQVKVLACGRFHSLAVSTCGSVFSWGVNGKAFRLGIEASNGGTPPSIVVDPTHLQEFGPGRHSAVKAAAGLNHSLVLTAQGKIFSWGSNANGQLGAQGVPTGSEAHARRPSPVKGSLKNEEVCDIAAGVEHSLCTVASGNIFTWGSNACGSLGLHAPPTGPAELAAPHQLPHLRGAYAVAASYAGHVSVVLAAHGDAVMFGALSPQAMTHPDARGGPSGPKADTARFFTSSRVRRFERKDSGEDDDWQMQRGSGAAASRLLSVTLGAEEAFAIDAEGALWTWPLNGPRPCTAKAVFLSAAPLVGSPSGGRRSSASAALTVPTDDTLPSAWGTVAACSGCLDTLWATDRSETSSLWKLRRSADTWHVERYEQLGQVSFVACGPEHEAAVVTYKRPVLQMQRDVAAQSVDNDSDDDAETQALQPCQVPTLQQLCENQLLRTLSARNFNLVCEVAWEFRRPELLDQAFSFLRVNAPFMFSRQHLATLAQLPLEVLCAFEMAANGTFAAPSAALDLDPWDFPPEDWRPSPDHDPAAPAMTSASDTASKVRTAASGTVRRRKRGGSGAGASPKAKASSPSCFLPAASKDTSPLLLPAPAMAMSPQHGPAKSPKVMPASTSAGNAVDPTKWVEVQSRRKPNGTTIGSASPSTFVASGKASPVSGPQVASAKSPSYSPAGWAIGGASSPTSAFKQATQNATLGDFVLPKAAVAPRKSSASDLADGTDEVVADAPPRGWAQAEPAEAPVSLKDILAEAPAAPKRRNSGKEEDDDSTHCSWGYDAMPSQRPKGPSVYEVQELERTEKSRMQEEAEVREIEAMFAALEIAEQAEEREKLGIPPPVEESPSGSSGAQASGGGKSENGKRGGRGRDEKKKPADAKKKQATKVGDEAANHSGSQRQRGWRKGNWNESGWSNWQWNADSWWQADAQGESQESESWGARKGNTGRGGRGGRGQRGKRGYNGDDADQRWQAKEEAGENGRKEDGKSAAEGQAAPESHQT